MTEEIVKKREGTRWRKCYRRNCAECGEEFLAPISDLKKGEAKFCSRNCSAVESNKSRKLIELVCVVCDSVFKSKSPQAKYCTLSCRKHQKAKISKAYQANPENHVYHLSGKIRKKHGRLPCMVKNCGCGWTKEFLEAREITCDIHHLKPKRDGGDDYYSNLTAACPNSHRLLDRGVIGLNDVITLEEYLKNETSNS